MRINHYFNSSKIEGAFFILAIPLTSHYLLAFRHAETLAELFELPDYWVALTFNIVVSIAIAYIVKYITQLGNKNLPW
ncbi:MAG: hypothetical protein EOO43_13250 [Flavobacterium sp.]|nr:MAG: hypothetical protein EOO43_13250 [Flavobacterium sp.]